jgi:hypothetical protein
LRVTEPEPRSLRPWLRASLAAGLVAAASAWTGEPTHADSIRPSSAPSALPRTGASPSRSSAEALAELGRVDPAEIPLALRGTTPSSDPLFERAMGHYTRGEHAAAAALWRDVTHARPRSGEAAFFLGISALISRDAAGALVALDRAAELGQQPYAGAAAFFAAKAELQAGRVARARSRLHALAPLRGHFTAEAALLLERLDAARAETPR